MKPDLGDLAAQCIRCGFCLESCPTFLETGNEVLSPRGRIYLAREAHMGKADWVADAAPALDSCLGCRACETACPSGVQYGALLELARAEVETRRPRRAASALVDALSSPPLAKLQITLSSLLPGDRVPGLLSWMLAGAPPEAAPPSPQRLAPWPALVEEGLPPVREEVALLEGCVMRVLFPRVHQATRRLLRRVGIGVLDLDLGCCGALHAHSGLLSKADARAKELCRKLPEGVRLVVNSAGCGSTLKSYGHLIAQGEEGVAERTLDITEVLLEGGLREMLREAPGVSAKAVYHDACHLAHGQKVRSAPRELLTAVPGLELRPLPESEVCCGSAGTYNLTQPEMARRLLERKMDNAASTGAQLLISGNPGCHAWMAQGAEERGGAIRVLHTAEVLESAFSGLPPRDMDT